MARGNRQDLFLNIRGDVTDLRTATVAGKTVLNDFSGTAVNVLEEVEKKFREVGAGGLPNIRKTEQAYVESFKRIRDAARAGADAGPANAIQILDANAARQQADVATVRAAALREVAEAASRADTAEQGNNAATRAYAVAASTAALEAEQMAKGLRDQAAVLTGVERQLESTSISQRKAIVISGQQRAGYQQLSYQLGDISTMYAMGASSSQIFASQSSQVIQALQLIGGEGNKVLRFLAGPWGIALASAAVAIIPFVVKMLESKDATAKAVEELKKDAAQSEVTARAKEIFSKSIEGVIAATNEQRRSFDESAQAQRSEAERTNIATREKFEQAKAIREATKARLEEAIAIQKATPSTTDSRTGEGQTATANRERVRTLEDELARANEAAINAEKVYQESRVSLAEEAAKRQVDPIAQIKKVYDDQGRAAENAARIAARGGEQVTSALKEQLAQIERNRAAELKAERDRQGATRQSGSANRQFGRQVTVSEATTIVGRIGGRVTSGVRSTERQAQLYADHQAGRHIGPVARPGTSAHEAGGAYDAIDVAYGKGISVKSIRDAFNAEGVRLRKILNEPSQRVFHVEFARAGASDDRAAERQRNQQEAEDRKRVQDQDAYASLLDQVQGRRLDLERSRTLTIEQVADLDVQAVFMARADIDRAAQKGVELGRWTQAQADGVKIMASVNAVNETMAIREREAAGVQNRQFDVEQAALGDRIEALRLAGELATTAGERRRIARQLLDLEEQQVKAALDNRVRNEADPVRKADLQRQLADVDTEYEDRGKVLDQQNADPLTRHITALRQSAKDIDEELSRAGENGFRALEDGLIGVISGTESVASAFGRMADEIIADLARIAARQLIVKALGGNFFSIPGAADGARIADIPGKADGGRISDIPGFATGGIPFVDQGIIRGPGDGRSDSILALVAGRKPIRISNGEAIVNERGVRNHWPLIKAINENRLPKFADGGLVGPAAMNPRMPSLEAARRDMAGGRRQRFETDVRVSVNPGPEFDARVESVSTRTVAAASEPIMAAAHDMTMRALNRPTLPGSF